MIALNLHPNPHSATCWHAESQTEALSTKGLGCHVTFTSLHGFQCSQGYLSLYFLTLSLCRNNISSTPEKEKAPLLDRKSVV